MTEEGLPGSRAGKNRARQRFAQLKRKHKLAGKRKAKERKKRQGQ